MSNSIVVVAHSPEWAQAYTEIASQLRSAVGEGPLRIDHIGSTSVAGLAAKDIIDIQITVRDLNQQMVTALLIEKGYSAIVDARDNLVGVDVSSIELRKHFLRQPEGQRLTHVHVRESGRINQRYPLLFRDYLRSEPVTRAAYEVIKLELAKRFADDSAAYYAIKDPYMDTVYQAALLWAKQIEWQPDEDFL